MKQVAFGTTNLGSLGPKIWNNMPSQSAFTCSKLTAETLEQGVKYVQS